MACWIRERIEQATVIKHEFPWLSVRGLAIRGSTSSLLIEKFLRLIATVLIHYWLARTKANHFREATSVFFLVWWLHWLWVKPRVIFLSISHHGRSVLINISPRLFLPAKFSARGSYAQQESPMTKSRTRVVTAATPALYRKAIPLPRHQVIVPSSHSQADWCWKVTLTLSWCITSFPLAGPRCLLPPPPPPKNISNISIGEWNPPPVTH